MGVGVENDEDTKVSSTKHSNFPAKGVNKSFNIGTVSKATLGILRDGVERIWAFLSSQIPS